VPGQSPCLTRFSGTISATGTLTWLHRRPPLRLSTWKVLTLALGFAILISVARGQQSPPDLILFNGKIFTSSAAQPYAEALAIRGERVAQIGSTKDISALAGKQTRMIDLKGRVVIPGINDAHDHLDIVPGGTVTLEFKGADPGWDEVKAAIVAAAAKAPTGAILAGEVGPSIYFDSTVNRSSLDAAAPDHPVILTTLTGHASIVNSSALALLGIAENAPDPAAGRYERSSDGKLNGVIREYAGLQINRKLAELTSEADAETQYRDFLGQAAKFGITSVQLLSDAMPPGRCVTLFEKAPTPIRIRVVPMPITSPAGRDSQEGHDAPRNPSPLITVSGRKWMLDGTPLEGTLTPTDAWQQNLRSGPDKAWSGLPLSFSEKEMESMLHEALAEHQQLIVHVSGYPSASGMLAAMQATGGAKVWNGKRVRFEHGDGMFPDLIPGIKEMGVVVVENPTHFAAVSLFPGLKMEKAMPLRSLLDAGIPIALGSDGPNNPYLNIMFASTHPSRPSEAITREQAVIAYTRTSAYAEFAENEKGSLEPGKLADLAVLSQDIFTVPPDALPGTESVLTIVGGKIVYDAKILEQ
jgi:predicted amidohydrolase YtcJ